jgi:hypothetical protein
VTEVFLSATKPDSGPAGNEWWLALVDDPEDVIEREMVGELLKTRDRLAEVRARIAEDGLMVAGSQGQPRCHPLLALERGLAADLWRSLNWLRSALALDHPNDSPEQWLRAIERHYTVRGRSMVKNGDVGPMAGERE